MVARVNLSREIVFNAEKPSRPSLQQLFKQVEFICAHATPTHFRASIKLKPYFQIIVKIAQVIREKLGHVLNFSAHNVLIVYEVIEDYSPLIKQLRVFHDFKHPGHFLEQLYFELLSMEKHEFIEVRKELENFPASLEFLEILTYDRILLSVERSERPVKILVKVNAYIEQCLEKGLNQLAFTILNRFYDVNHPFIFTSLQECFPHLFAQLVRGMLVHGTQGVDIVLKTTTFSSPKEAFFILGLLNLNDSNTKPYIVHIMKYLLTTDFIFEESFDHFEMCSQTYISHLIEGYDSPALLEFEAKMFNRPLSRKCYDMIIKYLINKNEHLAALEMSERYFSLYGNVPSSIDALLLNPESIYADQVKSFFNKTQNPFLKAAALILFCSKQIRVGNLQAGLIELNKFSEVVSPLFHLMQSELRGYVKMHLWGLSAEVNQYVSCILRAPWRDPMGMRTVIYLQKYL